MRTKLFARFPRVGCFVSAMSEYGFGGDFPQTPLVWLTTFLILCGPALIPTASAQTTNVWANPSRGTQFKWETASEWSLAVPPSQAQALVMITNNFAGGGIQARTVSIDATTVLSNAINGCMTISNLTLFSPSTTLKNEVFMNNTGSASLQIIDTLYITEGGALVITNSALTFPNSEAPDSQFQVDGSVVLEGGTISVNGSYSAFNEIVGAFSSGTLTVAGGLDNVPNSGLVIGDSPGSTGTVWITGGTLSMGDANYVGYSGVGSLIQSNGAVSAAGESLGAASGGQGLLAIAGGTNTVGYYGLVLGSVSFFSGGAGTVWLTGGSLLSTNPGGIYIGFGSLTQSNGTLAASTETVGEGFLSIFGPLGGDGTLTMAGGTHAVGFGGLTVATVAGSAGTVWVTGGELLATSFSNIIGADGVGSLVQSNGDVDMIFSEYVGYDAGADGTLIIAGGTHTVEDGELTVGNSAASTGAVWVTGGQLSSDSAAIGLAGVGQMTVSNGNWQAEDVSVGATNGGQGTLTVAGGMSVVSDNLTIGTADCTGTGTALVTGGRLFVTNAAHNAVLDLESGALTLSGGTLVVDVLVKTNPCAAFQQTGGTLVVGGVTNTIPSFQITGITPEGNNIQITWESTGGHTNAIQATNGGLTGSYNTNFSDLASFILGGSGQVTNTYIDPGGATNTPARYYRVRLVP